MPGNKFKSSKLFPKVAFAGASLALHGVGYALFQAPLLGLRAGLAQIHSRVAGKSPSLEAEKLEGQLHHTQRSHRRAPPTQTAQWALRRAP